MWEEAQASDSESRTREWLRELGDATQQEAPPVRPPTLAVSASLRVCRSPCVSLSPALLPPAPRSSRLWQTERLVDAPASLGPGPAAAAAGSPIRTRQTAGRGGRRAAAGAP
jgi:hypothetical protein